MSEEIVYMTGEEFREYMREEEKTKGRKNYDNIRVIVPLKRKVSKANPERTPEIIFWAFGYINFIHCL